MSKHTNKKRFIENLDLALEGLRKIPNLPFLSTHFKLLSIYYFLLLDDFSFEFRVKKDSFINPYPNVLSMTMSL